MDIDENLTDASVLTELGSRICLFRLDKNWTQSEVATQAGVGLRTVQRLESGEAGTQLSSFVRILRVLGLTERLNLLVPEAVPSPVAQLKLMSKRRQRASSRTSNTNEAFAPGASSKSSSSRVAENKSTWTWGE